MISEEINVPDIKDAPVGYWNSGTRQNQRVRVIGKNDNFYAVDSGGHVYVVPKRNISATKIVADSSGAIVITATTAPRPEEDYWLTLTVRDWYYLSDSQNQFYGSWKKVKEELRAQRHHTGEFINEWFNLSNGVARVLLYNYCYNAYKHNKEITSHLPHGESYRSVVRQLWEEQLRRDGIIPQ